MILWNNDIRIRNSNKKSAKNIPLDFLKEIPDHRDREGRLYNLAHILLFSILSNLITAKIYKYIW